MKQKIIQKYTTPARGRHVVFKIRDTGEVVSGFFMYKLFWYAKSPDPLERFVGLSPAYVERWFYADDAFSFQDARTAKTISMPCPT